ncbi:MAG: acyltransferase family protein [Lepagella sp.]
MKDQAIQIIRVAAMIYIVIYHCVCYYGIWQDQFPTNTIYGSIENWRGACNIALNAFVFISGYLYASLYNQGKYHNTRDLIIGKFKRLLYPYCMWAIIATILLRTENSIRDLFTGTQHLWFLLMLSALYIMIALCRVMRWKVKYIILGIVLCLVFNTLNARFFSDIPDYLRIRDAIKYMPAFLFGVIAVKTKAVAKLSQIRLRYNVMVLLTLAYISTLFIIIDRLPFGLLYRDIPSYFLILWLYVIISTRPITMSNTTAKLFNSFDKHSMSIYLIHHILIWTGLTYISWMPLIFDEHFIQAPIIMFLIVLPLSWSFSYVFSAWKYTQLLFTPKVAKA